MFPSLTTHTNKRAGRRELVPQPRLLLVEAQHLRLWFHTAESSMTIAALRDSHPLPQTLVNFLQTCWTDSVCYRGKKGEKKRKREGLLFPPNLSRPRPETAYSLVQFLQSAEGTGWEQSPIWKTGPYLKLLPRMTFSCPPFRSCVRKVVCLLLLAASRRTGALVLTGTLSWLNPALQARRQKASMILEWKQRGQQCLEQHEILLMFSSPSSSQPVYTRQKKNSLFVMGDYLQFIGTELLLNTWSSDVLTHCKRLFDHHGIPDELTTENKPWFTNDSFQHFSLMQQFKQALSMHIQMSSLNSHRAQPCRVYKVFIFLQSVSTVFKYKNWAISSKPRQCMIPVTFL